MEITRDKHSSIIFEDMLELMDYVENGDPDMNYLKFVSYKNSRHVEPSERVPKLGPTIQSTKDAIDKAVVGDHKLYDEYIKGMVSQIGESVDVDETMQKIEKVKRIRTRGAFGDEIDIHRVYRGDLNNAWSRMERSVVSESHPLVTILVNVALSWKTSAMDALWTTASIVKIVDDLQKAGKNIQLYFGCAIRDSAEGINKMDITFCAKRYNEHLNVERASAICNSGFLRTAGFVGLTSSQHELKYNMGYPDRLTLERLPHHIADEVAAGNTRVLIVNPSFTLADAISSIKDANRQMLSLTKSQ